MSVPAEALIPTYPITVTLSSFTGDRLPFARVIIQHHGLGNSTLGAVGNGVQEYQTDANGQAILELWPNDDQLSETYYTITSVDVKTNALIHNQEPFQVAAQPDDVWNRIELYRQTNNLGSKSTSAQAAMVAQAAVDAVTARDSLQLSLVEFGQLYLGPYATAPTLDNQGLALQDGALYFDTVVPGLHIYRTAGGWAPAGGDMFRSSYDPNLRGTDVYDRSNHIGTQLASTIGDFAAAVGSLPAVAANTAKRTYPSADQTKLSGIENNAEANLSFSDVRAGLAALNNTNFLTDTELSKLSAIQNGAEVNLTPNQMKDALTQLSDTHFLTNALLTKLVGIEPNAQRNFTATELKTSYEDNPDTNAFQDSEKIKLAQMTLAMLLPPGGGLGQVLKKLSDNDFDFDWVPDTSSGGSAATTTFDSTESGLGAANVQTAIDVLAATYTTTATVAALVQTLTLAQMRDRYDVTAGRVSPAGVHEAIDSRLVVVQPGELPAIHPTNYSKFFLELCDKERQLPVPITTVHGRAGDVTGALGDYDARQVLYDDEYSKLGILDPKTVNDILGYLCGVTDNLVRGEFNVIQGEGLPTNEIGTHGQYYLDSVTMLLYGPYDSEPVVNWPVTPVGYWGNNAALITDSTLLGTVPVVLFVERVTFTLPDALWTPVPTALSYVVDLRVNDSTGATDITDTLQKRRNGTGMELYSTGLLTDTQIHLYGTKD